MPADDHRRFRLLTTWDVYAKPKDELYKTRYSLSDQAHGLFNDDTLIFMRTLI